MIEESIEKLSALLKGQIPEKIDMGEHANEKEIDLAQKLNQLITFMQEIHEFIVPLF